MFQVVSNRMQKTVLVAFDRLLWNSKLKVHEKRSSKIMVRQHCSSLGVPFNMAAFALEPP
jgi:ribosomal protein S17